VAAKHGELEKVKQLVNKGGDVNNQDDNGVSAMRVYI